MTISADIGDILGSPVWTVLATLFAAAAIWVSIWLYRRQRTRKSLAYEIKVTELVSVHQAAKGRIKILFDEEEIGRVHLIEARIENNGNVPVTIEDFQQAIVFDLGEGATALTADVTKVRPEDMYVEAYPHKNEVEIQPLLLNPGDGLALKIFARNFQRKVKCHYRIVGISKMADAASQRQRQAQRTTLRRWLNTAVNGSGGLFLSTAAAGLGIVVLVAVPLIGWREEQKKTNAVVAVKAGAELCGRILETSDKRMVVQLADSGKIRPLAIEEVESVQDDAC